MESHSIFTPNEHHCDQRNTKFNQQAIDEKNEWKRIYHYTPIQLSLSLSKKTHVGGGVVEKRKKETTLQVTTSACTKEHATE
jgi:hypothetical protein